MNKIYCPYCKQETADNENFNNLHYTELPSSVLRERIYRFSMSSNSYCKTALEVYTKELNKRNRAG